MIYKTYFAGKNVLERVKNIFKVKYNITDGAEF
jgi:hypothetical protein